MLCSKKEGICLQKFEIPLQKKRENRNKIKDKQPAVKTALWDDLLLISLSISVI
jgi:hypothetical protein